MAGLAWRWPRAAALTGAVLAIPAFWNFAQAAALLWIVLAGAWAWASVRGDAGRRCLAPLIAGPLALIGLGPAFVLVAATAPTRSRRAVEAAAGAVVAATVGGWAGLRPVRTLSAANSPLIYLHVVERNPQIAATAAAMVLFAVLLAIAWRAERRLQAVTLWGLGFGLSAVAVPELLVHGAGGAGAGVAAAFTAIIPAAWAVAGPGLERGS
jgi:hypothetical protein